jgi:hypothetical protein
MKITVKKLFVPVLVIILAVIGFSLLTSCGDKITYVNTPTTSPYDTTVPSTVASTTTVTYYSTEQQFVDNVRATLQPGTYYVTDEQLVKIANIACNVLRTGGTGADLASALVETVSNDLDRTFIAKATGMGVSYVCPELSYRLKLTS